MNIIRTEIPEVLLLEPKLYRDSRGFFFESFHAGRWQTETGVPATFVQDNQSHSLANVLRGLHYQIRQAQGKLLRVLTGEIYDVAVDIRRSSPTFRRFVAVRLSAETQRMIWIPPGFAHGFLTLSAAADVLYKTTDYYAPESERTIRWNDAELGIPWPLKDQPIVSAKDQAGAALGDAELFD